MELFKLLGTIAIDNSDAKKALNETTSAAKDTAKSIEDSSSSGDAASGKLGNAFKKIGSGALAVGKLAVSGLAAGATALGALTVKAVSAAGDLEQNMGGCEQVFGNHAGKMQETAKIAFGSMGLSASDFLATSNKMGALFQGAGFGIEESATLSADAMQRAADVASIMGIDTASAMEAVAGAAKGNFTMMDNLGVAMNETTLQAYALEKGIGKSTSEMTNQEKIGLAMELFMEKTAYAAGNYAKENETLAGSLGTAKAALSNFLSGAGSAEEVVSSFSNAANVIAKNVTTIFPTLMNGLMQIVSRLVPMIPPLLEQLLPGLLSGAAQLITNVASMLPSIMNLLVTQVVPALLTALVTVFEAVAGALPSLITVLVTALPVLIPQILEAAISMVITLVQYLPDIIKPILDILPDLLKSIVFAVVDNLPILLEALLTAVALIVEMLPIAIMELYQALPSLITSILKAIIKLIPILVVGVVDVLVSYFKSYLAAAVGMITWVLEWLKPIWDGIKRGWEALCGGVKLAWDAICNAIEIAVKLIKSVVTAYVNAVKDRITTVFNAVKNTVANIFNSIKSGISSVVNSIKTTVTNGFNSVREAMEKPIQKARDTIKGILDKIKGFFSGLKLKFPNMKLPHFSIKPSGWKIGDLLEGSIPKLAIDWYAKAMDNPMIMTKPTIFGYNAGTGELLGGGESGSEVVSGTNTLMGMIGSAVAAQNGALAYYLQRMLESLSSYFPQILAAMDREVVLDTGATVGALAVPMNEALGKLSIRKDRGR